MDELGVDPKLEQQRANPTKTHRGVELKLVRGGKNYFGPVSATRARNSTPPIERFFPTLGMIFAPLRGTSPFPPSSTPM